MRTHLKPLHIKGTKRFFVLFVCLLVIVGIKGSGDTYTKTAEKWDFTRSEVRNAKFQRTFFFSHYLPYLVAVDTICCSFLFHVAPDIALGSELLNPPLGETFTQIININPLKTKRRLLYLKTQFVPRSKHFSSRL